MKRPREVWFFKRSLAARLARALPRTYKLCPIEEAHPSPSRTRVPEPAGPAVWLVCPASEPSAALRRLARRRPDVRLIAVAAARSTRGLAGREWFASLPSDASRPMVEHAVRAAFAGIALAARERFAREELERAEREREELNRIGVALSATHDVDALLNMILAKMREITGADAGSLYLVESARASGSLRNGGERRLRFKLTQNDGRQSPFVEYTLPIDQESIAGTAALHGEVVAIEDARAVPAGMPYRFNPRDDQDAGYHTRSLLSVPMKDARGEVIGVVQLLNCKRRPGARLLTPAEFDREVQPFAPHAIRLAESLSSQAAVAYENSRLYQDIEALFEGFVQAAVTAIEQRDPSTSGHSLRVSRLSVRLAELVDRGDAGAFRETRFTADQMKEIRYAALLHDFGKVGVREEVLVKAKKLYPAQLEVVESRFDYARRDIQACYESRKVRALLDMPREEALLAVAQLDEECRRCVEELEAAFAVVVCANEPTVVPSGAFERLFEIAQRTYRDPRGAEWPLLRPEEVRFLSIRQGSLDSAERLQIESHVVNSFNFLAQIPWTREIRSIPEIARAHHEKLNGTGYPYGLAGPEIPVQARMMTICDIFDALSASDRPYKKAVPPERALAILEDSVGKNEIDADLFGLFLDGRVYELTSKGA